MSDWTRVEDKLPELGDYSVIGFFAPHGGMDMIHVQDYFTNDWYKWQNVTHWHPLPNDPEE